MGSEGSGLFLATGARVGSYTVERPLGTGGTAAVYLVRHTTLGSRHALKLVSPDYLNHPLIQARLRHPNIVSVTDLVNEPGVAGLILEHVEGESLAQRIRDAGPMPWRDALRLITGVLSGVGAAHAAAVVHRDLKPSNILLDARSVPRVCDFGSVKLSAEDRRRQARRAATFGSVQYASPEQIHGAHRVDQRTDIWAIGAILYEMLSGRCAFTGRTDSDTMHCIVAGVRVNLRDLRLDLPEALYALVTRALSVVPDARFPDCRSMAAEVTRILSDGVRHER